MKASKVTVLEENSSNKENIKDNNKDNNKDINKSQSISVKEAKKAVVPFDNRVLPSEEYHRLWCKVIVDFTDTEPILAMCCNNAVEFGVERETLKVGFTTDTNMLLLEDSQNKEIILDKLFENRHRLNTVFYQVEQPVDNTQEKIEKLKGLFDKQIFKITKK